MVAFSFLHLSVQLASHFILIWDSLSVLDARDSTLTFPGLSTTEQQESESQSPAWVAQMCLHHSLALAHWALAMSLGRICTLFPLTDSDG